MNHGSTHMSRKQNSNQLYGSSKISKIQRKFTEEAHRNKRLPVLWVLLSHVAAAELKKRRTVNSEWYTTISLPEAKREICKKSQNR